MPSVAPIQVKTGSPAPPDLSKSDCEELGQKNEKERAKLVRSLREKRRTERLTRDEEGVLKMAKGAGMTFSSAKVSLPGVGGGVQRTYTGCSNAKAHERIPTGCTSGGTGAMKTGEEGIMCGDPPYKHKKGGTGGHAEAKIMNELTNAANAQGAGALSGGRILLNIDWRYSLPSTKKTYQSGMPCRSCYKMLCHAAKKCKIEIFLCGKDGQPVPMDENCDKKKGKAADDPYLRTDKAVDQYKTPAQFKFGQRVR